MWNIMFALTLFSCHIPLVRLIVNRVRKGLMPNTADFATLSAIVFYDIGFAVEGFGYESQNEFVPSLFDASSTTFLTAYIFTLAAPWAFQIGSYLVTSNRCQQVQEPRERLKRNRRVAFYFLTAAVVLPLCVAGTYRVLRGDQIWTARAETGREWGALIVFLYLPLHFLAFYVRQADSRSMMGRYLFRISCCRLRVCHALDRAKDLHPLAISNTFSFRHKDVHHSPKYCRFASRITCSYPFATV